MRTLSIFFAFLLILSSTACAQERVASPRGEASTQIEGSWIVVEYGRPILRGRTEVFGTGDEYGVDITGGAPVWRAGANQSTRFMTESDLNIGRADLPAGEYSLFVDLSGNEWTLILSNHKARPQSRSEEPGIWGAYDYSADLDVLRVPMQKVNSSVSHDQLTMAFYDVSTTDGTFAIMWEDQVATVSFELTK